MGLFQHALMWLLVFCSVSVQGQDLYYERLPAEMGLSQNVISCLHQDKKGFIWVGTNNGLNRFDGYRFTTYRYDPFDPLSIPGSVVSHIFEDKKGRFWITTEHGLALFDPEKENFYPLSDGFNSFQLDEDYAGNLWQGSTKQGALCITPSAAVSKIDPNQFQFIHMDGELSKLSFMTPIWVGPDLGFTFSAELGAFRIGLSQIKKQITIDKQFYQAVGEPYFKSVAQMMTDMDSASRHFLRGFELDRLGRVWMSNKNRLMCWDPGRKEVYEFPVNDSLVSPTITSELRWSVFETMALDRRNRLWLGGFNGTFMVELPGGHIRLLFDKPGDNEHPLCYGAGAFMEDRSGLVWIGTKGKGLVKYNDHARRFSKGLWKGASIRVLYKTTDGLIWFGTPIGSLHYYNPRTNTVRDMSGHKRWNGYEIGTITAFYEDTKSGALWVSAGNHGLMKIKRWQESEPEFTIYPIDETKMLLSQMAPTGIAVDKTGYFWMTSQLGIIRFNPADGSREIIPFFGDELSRINDNRFPVILLDRSERVWAGTSEGLLLLDYATKSFIRYQNDRANPRSLPHNQVKCIVLDPQQPDRFLWVGTGGGGLSRFDTEQGTFEHFTEKDGLPDMVVYAALPDSAGNLWLSTNKGLSVFNISARTFRNFDEKDGLQNLEFNTLAYSIAYDGEFLFGGIEGFNHFFPGQMLNTNSHMPEIVFTDFKISGKSVSHKTPGSPLKNAIAYTRKIVLSHDVKVISFDFAAMDFADPAKNQFSCKMEGFDKDWQPLGNTRTATYTNLSPGKYVFRVRGSNNDGVWNMEGAAIEIVVLAPWWANTWAYLLYAIIAASIIYAFYRLEVNRNKAAAEAQRLQELNNAKSIFLTTVSHELRTPLTSIMGFSKIIKKRMEERLLPNINRSDPRTDRAADQVMGNLDIVVSESERLTTLINSVLDLSKIESGKIVWHEDAVDMSQLIDRALMSASALLEEKNLALYKKVDENLPVVYGDPDRLLQVLVNLLSNAVKFTKEGAITVSAQMAPSEHPQYKNALLVGVRDTGVGIPENMLTVVFDKFHQVSSDTLIDKPQGSGLGLAICKEIVEHHDGRIWVESTPGVGSTFWFTIPYPLKNG